MVRYFALRGDIQYEKIPGGKQGFYRESDVAVIAAVRNTYVQEYQNRQDDTTMDISFHLDGVITLDQKLSYEDIVRALHDHLTVTFPGIKALSVEGGSSMARTESNLPKRISSFWRKSVVYPS